MQAALGISLPLGMAALPTVASSVVPVFPGVYSRAINSASAAQTWPDVKAHFLVSTGEVLLCKFLTCVFCLLAVIPLFSI